jgi:hypothetical protein
MTTITKGGELSVGPVQDVASRTAYGSCARPDAAAPKSGLDQEKLGLDIADVRWKVRTRWVTLLFDVGKVVVPIFAVLIPAVLALATLLAQTSQFLEQQASEQRSKTRDEVFKCATLLADTTKPDDLPLRIMAARRLGTIGLSGLPPLLDQLAEKEENRLYIALLNSVETIIVDAEQSGTPRSGSEAVRLLTGPLVFVARLVGVDGPETQVGLRNQQRERILTAFQRFQARVVDDLGRAEPAEGLARAYITAISALRQARPHTLADADRMQRLRDDVDRITQAVLAAIGRNKHASAQPTLERIRVLLEAEGK